MPYYLIPAPLFTPPEGDGKSVDNDLVRVPYAVLETADDAGLTFPSRQTAHAAIRSSVWPNLDPVHVGGWLEAYPRPDILILDAADLAVYFRATEDEVRDAHAREVRRLHHGEYLPLPRIPNAGMESYDKRYAHFSRDKDGMIAYTPSREFLIQDRQLRVRPGRYLATFYPSLTAQDQATFAGACGAVTTAELSITTDPHVITTVYRRGPHSCMKGSGEFQSTVHPCTVYGDSPDLALAYTGPIDSPMARAIVWPDRSIHSRIYGNTALLEAMLQQAGYHAGDLRGARVRAIDNEDGRYIMPYVDGIGEARLDRTAGLFTLGEGSYRTDMTDGTTGDSDDNDEENTCEHCGDPCGDDTYCGACDDARWTCDRCHDAYYSDDNRISLIAQDLTYCDSCYENAASTCVICDDAYDGERYARSTRADRNDRNVHDLCQDCGDTHDHCAECGDEWADRTTCGRALCPACTPPAVIVTAYKGPGTQSLAAQLQAYAYDRGIHVPTA